MKKIFFSISGNLVFSIKVQDAPKRQNPFHGDVDIIFDAPKFENINGIFINKLSHEIFSNVKSISWHGFYVFKNNKIINPSINLHYEKPHERTTYRHDGIVNKSDKFAFPIASFTFNGDEIKGFKKQNCRKLELKYKVCTVDIFILPKHLSLKEFSEKAISLFFFVAGMGIYDRRIGCAFEPIDMKTTKYHHEVVDGRTILFRERKASMRNNMGLVMPKGIFSILHDPDSPLEAILERGDIYDENGQVAYNLRERYNQEKFDVKYRPI
ncbi:hypothetical protein [Photobacterium carnosum]|uniref:hypothetical protein n=1 Tax=Photobacterium carnosum TaxID=2023717 RepID=UPI001E47A20C|nr:hypothetical protein [Photobacterium carnosum]MCD9496847.1 hypothetical protein [Photobacterium carnosum]